MLGFYAVGITADAQEKVTTRTSLHPPKGSFDNRPCHLRRIRGFSAGYSFDTLNMALITAMTIIRSLSLFHLILAYYFLTSPSTIVNHSIALILGASMNIVGPPITPAKGLSFPYNLF
jgi:hypothetical protein